MVDLSTMSERLVARVCGIREGVSLYHARVAI